MKTNPENNNGEDTPQRGAPPKRPFPMYAIEESLKILKALREFNGGNPWTPSEVAKALDRGAKTPDFYYLTAASRDYGLTTGTSKSTSIAVGNVGQQYMFAESPLAEKDAFKNAFFAIRIFKDVFDYYQGGKLPEMKYLQNNLEGRFQLERRYHADFHRIFQANCAFIESIVTGPALGVSRTGTPMTVEVANSDEPDSERVFVIMPFSEKTEVYPIGFYNEVLTNLITPAAITSGFSVYTARKDGSDLIHATIINELMESPMVICDLTEHNPNVLFELGFRIAQGKPVVLIRAKGTAPVFDVDNLLRVWDYDPNLWKSTLERDIAALAKHINGAWENRNSPQTYLRILTGRSAEVPLVASAAN